MLLLIAKFYFWLIGWKAVKGIPPHVKKYVMIGAPHTSNWDFPIAMAALTRGYVKDWKSGFYHVATGANVPIALAYLDYGKKEAGIAKFYYPSGNYEKDIEEIKSFYRGITARHPEKSSVR
jgi:1-acyl-sn-glycerol-3-phosphate acyltransferase